MDTIMQYTAGLLTAVATFGFAVTYLLGIWASVRFGAKAILPSIILAVAVTLLRAQAEPLSVVAIVSMCGLHVAAGVWLGVLLNRRKPTGPANK